MVHIAVEGCCHGDLDQIYRALSPRTELLVVCGDFQALRNAQDLHTISVPPKYRAMGDFCRYYSGEQTAPVLTVVIGGNHECSSYMRELQYGGWLAPNIYYLGDYGAVWYKGLKVCGASGIYNRHTFAGRGAASYALPYGRDSLRSVYHVKPKTHVKLLLSGTADIAVSHDWPQGVWEWGDVRSLLRKKPFFRDDVASGRLGSPLARQALHTLRPRYWYASHLHTKFAAVVRHDERAAKKARLAGPGPPGGAHASGAKSTAGEQKPPHAADVPAANGPGEPAGRDGPAARGACSAEIALDMDADSGEIALEMDDMDDMDDMAGAGPGAEPPGVQTRSAETRFMALDKCLPKRHFLVEEDIPSVTAHPSAKSTKLFYDPRAIAIQKVVETLMRSPQASGVDGRKLLESGHPDLLAELADAVDFEMRKHGYDLAIPENFAKTAPDETQPCAELRYWPNPQTAAFCARFGVPEPDLDGP